MEAYNLLNGLNRERSSFYFAKKQGWEYPLSAIEDYVLALVDFERGKAWDKAKDGVYKPSHRPYPTDNDKKINYKAMPIERARILYKVNKADLPADQIKAYNKAYMEKLRNKNGA